MHTHPRPRKYGGELFIKKDPLKYIAKIKGLSSKVKKIKKYKKNT